VLLGIMAAISGIVYAVAKFLTTLRIRRLRLALTRVQGDVQQSQQLLEVLDGKRKVESSKRKTMRNDTSTLRDQNDAIHSRLRADLSADFLPRIDLCMEQDTKGETNQASILRELKLADQITAALDSMSLLIVEFTSGDTSETAVSLGQFAQLLEASKVNFNAPDSATVIATFDNPTKAFELLKEYGSRNPADHPLSIRGSLYTGVQITEEAGDLNRFLSQHLQVAQKLSVRAAVGTILLNENAYQGLASKAEVKVFDQSALLYSHTIGTGSEPPGTTAGGKQEKAK
jgi:hypothetical protein